jgi:hypothetical protein
MSSPMNGAESLVKTLLACGVDTCFANPGTSEMHFVAALDRIPGMRCVLGLFEGVVTGAADGYARMAGKPAPRCCTAVPGLANGLANLHNAYRANTPMVNIVGDQATYHRPLDAPLSSDTEGWARPISVWTRTATHAASVGAAAAEAVQAACARARRRRQPDPAVGCLLGSGRPGGQRRWHRSPCPRCRPLRCSRRRGCCVPAPRRCSCWAAALWRCGAGSRASHCRGQRCEADVDHGHCAGRARPRALRHRTPAVFRRRGARAARRHPPPHPRRNAGAGDLLRLSRQARRVPTRTMR